MNATVYLHSTKEQMYETGRKLGLTGKALDYFQYACYEVKLELDVNEETGSARIVKCDDRPLPPRA